MLSASSAISFVRNTRRENVEFMVECMGWDMGRGRDRGRGRGLTPMDDSIGVNAPPSSLTPGLPACSTRITARHTVTTNHILFLFYIVFDLITNDHGRSHARTHNTELLHQRKLEKNLRTDPRIRTPLLPWNGQRVHSGETFAERCRVRFGFRAGYLREW